MAIIYFVAKSPEHGHVFDRRGEVVHFPFANFILEVVHHFGLI